MICPICHAQMNGGDPALFSRFRSCPVCTGYSLRDPALANYGEEYFVAPEEPTLFSWAFAPFLRAFFALRIRQVARTLEGRRRARILDYGCGTGGLFYALRARGYDVMGYEPSVAAVRVARSRGLPVSRELPVTGDYNLIMFWHSLEHVDNPLEVLMNCRKLLAPEGKFLIAVPNAASWEAFLAGERWFHYDYPFHRIHFTPRAISCMFDRIGFCVERWNFFNPDYTFSGLGQTFLNLLVPKNVLYSVLTHRRTTMGRSKAFLLGLVSLLLLVLAAPFLVTYYLIALAARKTGAVIAIAGQR